MPLYMSIHTLTPGAFTPGRIEQIARLGQQDPVVRGYRSFHSLQEGRIVWLLDAPSKDAVIAWCKKVGLPLEGVTELELEGFVGMIRPARMAIPNQLPAVVEAIQSDGVVGLVTLRLRSGDTICALVDSDDCAALGIVPGAEVLALCKATSISLAPAAPEKNSEKNPMKLSFPNQIRGKVVNMITSSTLVIIYIDTPAGQVVSAMIPSAAEQIELKVGDEVTALFKALDVSLAKS